MIDLRFTVQDVFAEPYAAVPQLTARLRVAETTGERVHAIALRCQVRIDPQRRRYAEDEQDALLGADAQLAEDVTAPVHERCELRVRGRAVGADQGSAGPAPLLDVAVDEVRREVEPARDVVVRQHAATSRTSSTTRSTSVSNVRSPSSAVASAGAPQ